MNSAIEKLTQALAHYPYVEKVILFGSRARGDGAKHSDIDVAVLCKQITKWEWHQLLECAERVRTLLSIDLVRYDDASDELKKRISKEGVVLYERD